MKIDKTLTKYPRWSGVLKIKNGWGLDKTNTIHLGNQLESLSEFLPNVTHKNLGKAFKYQDGTNTKGAYFFVEEEDFRYDVTTNSLDLLELASFLKTLSKTQQTTEIVLTLTPIFESGDRKLDPIKLELKPNTKGDIQKVLYKGVWIPNYDTTELVAIEGEPNG